ncbi:Ig-like domain-containing protein [Vibrio mytili]|uniref:T1SS-143 repeat domain-containing protein n=1 Tax=Vibrio mytili TaxID=50718 RepID=UPI0039ED7AAF
MTPIIYIQVGSVKWAILSDGSWVEVLPTDQNVPGVETLVINTESLDLEPDSDSIDVDFKQIAAQITSEASSAFSEDNSDFTESSEGASFVSHILAVLPEKLVEAGFDTRGIALFDNKNEQEFSHTVEGLRKDAELTVDILDGGDGYENQFEVPSVTIQGGALEVNDDWVVQITITDSLGQTVNVSAIVKNESYQVTGIDLTSLEEGPLTVTAVITDTYGESISANDTTIKDTLADIAVDFEGNGDRYLNQFEIESTRIEGKVENVEDGQSISISVTDENGTSVSFNTTVNGGSWSLDEVDLSSMEDGVLTVVASSEDIAGNPTTAQNTIVKDTQALITIDVEDGGDGYLNSAERHSVTLFGQVTGVEDGQTVDVVVTDSEGTKQTLTAVVSSGEWRVENQDLTALADGALTVTASTSDIAGNPATSLDSATVIDSTFPTIDIDTSFYSQGGLDVESFRQGTVTEMRGSTSGVEPGLDVVIRVSDGQSDLTFTGKVDASGNWRVDDINVDALDQNATWTIEAEVWDIAGNSVLDDMPTIVLPDATSFSENIIYLNGQHSGDANINIENAQATFHSDQFLIANLTSVGQPIETLISNGGKTLTGTSADNRVVFTAQINDNGTVDITFFEVVDQAPGEDYLITALLIDDTQIDADGTSETVVAKLPITIYDSDPLVRDESYTVTEGETVTGNVLDNDVDLDGQLHVRVVEVNGQQQRVPDEGSVTFNLDKGVLTVHSNGDWELVASRNLDNTIEQTVTFRYAAGDLSDDYGLATTTINVLDGEPGSIEESVAVTKETSLSDSLLRATSHTNVLAGSDNPDPDSLIFDAASLAKLQALELTSSVADAPLEYALSTDAKQITASVNGVTVFTLLLSGTANGNDVIASIDLELNYPLDQVLVGDFIELPLVIEGQDLDSSSLGSNNVTFVIQDGVDPALTNTTQLNVNEVDLLGGDILSGGSFSLDIGSDYVDELVLSTTNLSLITSGGKDVLYQIADDGLSVRGYILDSDGSTQVDVFKVVLDVVLPIETSGDISYRFELYRALDQLEGDPLNIPLVVIATDSDSDTTSIPLDINVYDNDNGEIVIPNNTVELTENPKDPAVAPDGVSATANVQVTGLTSLDPIVFLGLTVETGDTVVNSDGGPVTYNGAVLTWRDNGDGSYDAVTQNDETVFEVLLPGDFSLVESGTADISVQVNLYREVDHVVGDGTQVLIPVPIVTRDSDGTEISAESNIRIYDGLSPEIVVNSGVTTNENGLVDDGQEPGSESSTPSLTFIRGSDDVVRIDVDTDAFNALNYKTSTGSLITLNSSDSEGWLYAIDESSQHVFRIRFNLDGTVEFDLYQAMEHAPPSGVLFDENELLVNFSISVTDNDGDSSPAETYSVSVTDDIPDAISNALELTEGDEYIGNWFTNNSDPVGADGAVISSITYQGVTYDENSGNYSNGSWVIDLLNADDGNNLYGTLVIAENGDFELNTAFNVTTPVGGLFDNLTLTVMDSDGDQVDSNILLTLNDSQGFIRLTAVDTLEDNGANNGRPVDAVQLPIRVFAGDNDNNERVEEIRISVSSLQGGTLYLDDVELNDDDNDGFVSLRYSDGQLREVGSFAVPKGTLIFEPALNVSDNTLSVSLEISSVITSDINPDGVVLDASGTLDVNVLPVADAPEWAPSSVFEYQTVEDSNTPTVLDIVANLFDLDGSETLQYKISNIPDGLEITRNGSLIVEGKAYNQNQLNQMQITSDRNVAGKFTFDIKAISTEAGNVFADNSDKTAEISHQVIVNVSPDADTPSLSVKNIKGLEDQLIDLKNYVSGSLSDTDGSETLAFRIEVQDGWTLPIGAGITLIAANTYMVSAQALASSNALLTPKEDISSYTESLSIQVTAMSTESTVDGLAPINETAESGTKTVAISLKGVVDEPVVSDAGQGHWQYDGGSKIISNASPLNEDALIQLDFIIQTSDDDVSEEINVLLGNIPQGTSLVDVNGDPVTLPIAYVDALTGPVYQVSNTILSKTYLKPAQDFSGLLTLDVTVVSTEPDGDSAEFPLTVEMDVSPVVDQKDGQSVQTSGVEDRSITLHLEPVVDQDIDESESLTGYSIDSIPAGLTLYFDGAVIESTDLPLDLNALIDTNSSLIELLNSGRFTVIADEDLSGAFSIDVTYEVTDVSPTGKTDTKDISGTLDIAVAGKVDIGSEDVHKTRLEGTSEVLTSTDGSAIDISGAITFTEEDLDGSEYLDYIVVQFNGEENLVISHPNGVSQDANGNWLIPMGDITSDSVVETAKDLLAGATIFSPVNTGVLDIVVKGFVKDGTDSQYISGQFQIQVTGHSGGTGGGCEAPGEPGSVQSGDIVASEGENINLGQYLNPDVASSDSNSVSFFVPAASLPDGVEFEGEGVTPAFDTSGNLLGYSITASGLETLMITGIDEDFAGCISFSMEVTETAPCDGETKTTSQTITVQIAPVVDDINVEPNIISVQEDTRTTLGLDLVLGDSVEAGQTISGEGNTATGLETVNWIRISVSDDAVLLAQDNSLLVDNGDGTWTITDAERLNEVQLLPPENYSGELVLTVDVNITDEVTDSCLSSENAVDTQTKTTSVSVMVEPVVDKAILTSQDVVGNEDNYISLGNLSASLVDQDGSESMSLIVTGVPKDAVLVWNNNGNFELLPNNGSTNGTSTEWQVSEQQLSNIYLLPPPDFSGDIPLTLEAITQEKGTTSYNNSSATFNVAVLPIGDNTDLDVSSDFVSGRENNTIHLDFEASSTETSSNEYLEVSMIINSSSDASSLEGLGRIRIGNQFALFNLDDNGNAVATILVRANEVDGLDFIPKNAFGSMDVTLSVRTYDKAIVSGVLESDYGDPETQDLTIRITPEPDEPMLTAEYNSIVSEASGEIPLGLEMTLVAPASNETGSVMISGLPAGLELNYGTYSDGVYKVDYDNVSDLSIIGGYSGAEQFELTITPEASIDDQSALGLPQVVSVSLVEVGDSILMATADNDLLIGGDGNDTFVFDSSGVGTLLSPSRDVISDFQTHFLLGDNDTVDVSAIVSALTINGLDNKIDLAEDSQGVTLSLKPEGAGTKQEILLAGTTIDDLYRGDSTGVSEADVLQKMIDDNNLVVGGLS